MDKEYNFEILIIDPDGNSEIKSQKSLLHGLLSTEKLWGNPVEIDEKGRKVIKDEDLSLYINPIDTSSVLYNLYESAFLIQTASQNFDRLEKFRYPLVIHLKSRLKFNHIRILTDDISTHISNQIYPLINELEGSLRRYLAKFFIQKVGLDWWKQAVPDKLIEKTKLREANETVFSKIVQTDMTLIDFNDLGEIIYKHKLGFNKPENLVDKVLSISTEDELIKLKDELDGNYNRFFKQHFKDLGFEKKWKDMFLIRNKVAHNNLFTAIDLQTSQMRHEELMEIINKAESNIDAFRFSIVEQEAMIKTSELIEPNNSLDENRLPGLKIIDKIDLPEQQIYKTAIISESVLLEELKRAEKSLKSKNLTFIGLKSFVTNILGVKGYSYGPTYAQINVLKDKGLIELYDIEEDFNLYPVKAVRLIK